MGHHYSIKTFYYVEKGSSYNTGDSDIVEKVKAEAVPVGEKKLPFFIDITDPDFPYCAEYAARNFEKANSRDTRSMILRFFGFPTDKNYYVRSFTDIKITNNAPSRKNVSVLAEKFPRIYSTPEITSTSASFTIRAPYQYGQELSLFLYLATRTMDFTKEIDTINFIIQHRDRYNEEEDAEQRIYTAFGYYLLVKNSAYLSIGIATNFTGIASYLSYNIRESYTLQDNFKKFCSILSYENRQKVKDNIWVSYTEPENIIKFIKEIK